MGPNQLPGQGADIRGGVPFEADDQGNGLRLVRIIRPEQGVQETTQGDGAVESRYDDGGTHEGSWS